MSQSESRSAIVLGMAEEFIDRLRRGERPSVREYIDRQPDLADEIREVFPAMAMMENIALADESLNGGSSGAATASTGRAPEQLGDYRILREVGRGGMGVVYEAEQMSLGRHVALKLLPQQLLGSDNQRRRFEREARAAARLHHTNIVPVFGIGEHEGTPYYVMQFISGLGLDKVLDEVKRMHAGREAPAAKPGTEPSAARDVSAAVVARSLMTGHFEAGRRDEDEVLDAGATVALSPRQAQDSNTPKPAIDEGSGPGSSVTSSSLILRGGSSEGRRSKSKSGPSTYWQGVARIGMQVADALEYAHKQGIQHRDIKPSNLLMDTRGTAWVTDFGLAKADDQQNLTHTGDILGTLRYMPPEAFEGKVDARGDVYSLGVTLYELLALRPAFDEKERGRLVKQVTGVDPPRLGRLNPDIPRDLETVVHKAIERDPSHRYATAGELEADLQRFLDDEPIQARRLSPRERAGRWCRRNPVVAGLSAALVLLLSTACVTSLLAAAHFDRLARKERQTAEQERNARLEAQESKREADANFAKARKAVDDYLTRVSESQLLQVPGLQPLRRELLQSALGFYQAFVKEHGNDPSIRAGLGAAYLRVGRIQSELGKRDEATKAHLEAVRLYEALLKENPGDLALKFGLAQSYRRSGALEKAIPLWKELVADEPGEARYRRELAETYNTRASQQVEKGDRSGALKSHQEALALRETLVRNDPEHLEDRNNLGATLNNLGVMLSGGGRLADALAMYRRAVEHARFAFEKAPHHLTYGRYLVIQSRNIATMETQTGHPEQALHTYQQVVDVAKKLAVENPDVPGLLADLKRAYLDLRAQQLAQGKTEDAARSLRQARAVLERLPQERAEDLYNLACVRALCASLSDGRGGEEETQNVEDVERREDAELAIAALRAAVAAGYDNVAHMKVDGDLTALRSRPDFQEIVANLEAKVVAAEKAKRTQVAEDKRLEADRRALAVRQKEAAAHPEDSSLQADLAASQNAFALILLDLGRSDEALRALEQVLSLRKALANAAPANAARRADVASTHLALGNLHWKTGRPAEGSRAWQTGLEAYESALRDHPKDPALQSQAAEAYVGIANVQAQAGIWADAAGAFSRAFALHPPARSEEWKRYASLLAALGDMEGYRHHCDAMLKRFGKSPNAEDAYLLTWACTAAPGALADPARLVPLADATAGPLRNDAGRVSTAALAYYRAGLSERALAETRNAMTLNRDWPPANFALTAMIYHRLGRDEEARFWMSRTDQLQEEVMRSLLSDRPVFTWEWWDLVQFEALRREARAVVAGMTGSDEPRLQLRVALAKHRMNQPEDAEAAFQAAVAASPQTPALYEARARAFAQIGLHDRAESDFDRAIAMRTDDPRPRIDRGRYFAGRGKSREAAADFDRAATETASELNAFTEAGWWVAGPYPEDLALLCPPERDPDPSRPLPAEGTMAAQRWKDVPTGPNGRIDLRSILQADHCSAYALSYVHAPEERCATLRVGGEDHIRVWLNGILVYEAASPRKAVNWAWGLPRVPVTLRAGRNTLLVKVSHGNGPHSLFLRLNDSPLDRSLSFAELGLWDEAAKSFAAIPGHQIGSDWWMSAAEALVLRASGDIEGYRRVRDRAFERFGWERDVWAASNLAYIAGLSADAGFDHASLADLMAPWVSANPRVPWQLYVIGLAEFRAGRYQKAIERLEQSRAGEDGPIQAWPVLAMACHHLQRPREAHEWLAKCDAWIRNATATALEGRDPQPACGQYWLDLARFQVYHREAKTLIEGTDPGENPGSTALRARVRDDLASQDKTSIDYRLALWLQPTDPYLWLALGRHHVEQRKWAEAEVELTRAASLTPGDPEVWMLLSRAYTGLNQPDKFAGAIAKSRDLQKRGR